MKINFLYLFLASNSSSLSLTEVTFDLKQSVMKKNRIPDGNLQGMERRL